MPTVRVVTERDVDQLVESVTNLFRDDAGQFDPLTDTSWPQREGHARYSALVSDPDWLLLLAYDDGGRLIGHLVGRVNEPGSTRPHRSAVLESIYIWADIRSQGVGALLTTRFLDWAREQNAVFASVSAYAANEKAQRFYQRQGFASQSVMLQTVL
ncbi:GNAT family N-acetyltransferase [Kribbella deserti]|uniref:GNAT family N-acetyltransferase n=1 Tax=Kribbella deserti TaxID=1926257 RepID=A0ABV6QQ56_9ACTN